MIFNAIKCISFVLNRKNVALLAQSVEQGTENPCVRGSIPREGTKKSQTIVWLFFGNN